MNLNVRISGGLKSFVTQELRHGDYENISEYIRDLIRRDKARVENEHLMRLRTELEVAFAQDESEYKTVSPDDIRRQAKRLL